MNNKNKLFRNTENKMLGGVAAGFADYFDIDVTLVRVIFVLAIFIPISFPIIFAYLALWIVMPARKPHQSLISIDEPSGQ